MDLLNNPVYFRLLPLKMTKATRPVIKLKDMDEKNMHNLFLKEQIVLKWFWPFMTEFDR